MDGLHVVLAPPHLKLIERAAHTVFCELFATLLGADNGHGADELCFVSDVPGVMEQGSTLAHLDRAAIDDLVARDVAQGGMRAKLEAALVTLGAGVRRVRITDISGITDPMTGTTISLDSVRSTV